MLYMSQSPSQFDVSSLNGAQQCDCWRHHSSSRVCVRSVAYLGFLRFHQWKKPGSRSILSPPLQNFHVVLPTKKCLLCFLSLTLNLCRPFSRCASPACRLLSLFLCLSLALFSKFVGHDDQSKLNTLENTDTETISAFHFPLHWLFSCFYFTRRGWLCDFPSK